MKKIILITIAVILCSVCFVAYKFFNATKVEDTLTKNIKQNNNMLSMMIETEAGSGKYEMTSTSSWPTDGYVFNSELSKCENGGTLQWDDTNKKVLFEGNNIDKCYVYFDVYIKPSLSISNYIKNLYTGTQGENNIYYHDATLTNGAGDNSYRFAGASAEVNNYICVGSDAETCPEDNLYRIVGVFGDNNHGVTEQQLVKVIKNTSYGEYAWDTASSNIWANATLNSTLNTKFKTEKISGFEDKIVEVSWRVSGNDTNYTTAKSFYTKKITNATIKYTAKVGLIYVSDYGFATTTDYWTTNLDSYNSAANQKDWLYLGTTEWTLTPSSYSSNFAWYLTSDGFVDNFTNVTISREARPSFYLNSDVNYVSGTGTSTDPIRIKL